MNKRLHALVERKNALVKHSEALLALIDKERRDFTDKESTLFDANAKELEEIKGKIAKEEERSAYRPTTTAADMNTDRYIDDAPSGGGLSFQNASTGEVLRTLRSNERMCTATFSEPHPAGRRLHSWLTGRNDQPDMMASIQRGGVDTGGGYLFDPTLSKYVTDLARAASVCQRAGAQTIPMETNELHLVRLASDPTAHWRPEGVAVTSTGVTFDRVILRSHTLAAIIPITLELLEDAPNAGQVIEQALASAIGSEIDRVCLCGKGSESEPLGIRNASGLNTQSTIVPSDYTQVSKGVRDIYAANFQGKPSDLSWIMSPREGGTYDRLVDLNGNPLQPTPWCADVQRYITSTISTTEGEGADSYMVVGDFSQMLIGVRNSGVQFRRIPAGVVTDADGTDWNAVTQLLEHLVAHVRIDVAIMRPSWFSLLTGVADLPEA